MPGLDRSGPMGAGSMTGGRRGLCGRSGRRASFLGQRNLRGDGNSNVGRGPGCGFRMNRGGGRGFGRGAYDTALDYSADTPKGAAEELEMLRTEADELRKTMEVINHKINALENENSE